MSRPLHLRPQRRAREKAGVPASCLPCCAQARYLQLLEICEGLSALPERGGFPKELESLGIREYRRVYFGPYRIIYRVMREMVLMYFIADGATCSHFSSVGCWPPEPTPAGDPVQRLTRTDRGPGACELVNLMGVTGEP